VRRFTPEERRARLARRHHLAPANRVATATEVARDIVGLHSTDPATVFVSAWARMKNADMAGIERELYDDRSLVRVLVMRRTAFVLPPDLAGIALAACSRSVGRVQRRQLEQWIDKAGIARNPSAWLRKLEQSTFEAVAARGTATAAQVSSDVPTLQRRLQLAVGTRNETSVTLAPFVLRLLAVDGRLIRGRPRGGWLSTQWSWATTESWLGDAMGPWAIHEAQVDLVRAWLKAFGPATVEDVRWWTGWTLGEVRRALTEIKPVEVDLGGTTGIALASDLAPTRPPRPFVSLLPGLDPTVMGWYQRDWYLSGHRAPLFDRSGNAGPTVWCDGRVVGGWAQRRSGEIAIRLLEDVGKDATQAIDREADRLRSWLGEKRRVMPRFSTPLVKELAAEVGGTGPRPRSRTAQRQSQKRRPG
jgi:hypothetical protein